MKKLVIALCVVSLTVANTITMEHQEPDTGNKKRKRGISQGSETKGSQKKIKTDELSSEAIADHDRAADSQTCWNLLHLELKAQVLSNLICKPTFKELLRCAFVNKEFSALIIQLLAKIKKLLPSDRYVKVTLELLLLRAVLAANVDCVRDLLELGAHANARDEYNNSPLIMAARYGKRELVQLLLAYRANPNIVDAHDKTALMWASQNGHTDIVDLLLCRDWATRNDYVDLVDKIESARSVHS